MKKLQNEIIVKKAVSAFKEFVGEMDVDKMIKNFHWGRTIDKFTYEFWLYDHSMYPEWGAVTGKIEIDDRPEKLKSKHILTIYVDRYNGNTFVRRMVKELPWEKTA